MDHIIHLSFSVFLLLMSRFLHQSSHNIIYRLKVLHAHQGCIYLIEKAVKIFEIEIFCAIINVFTLTFDQLNALNTSKIINFLNI